MKQQKGHREFFSFFFLSLLLSFSFFLRIGNTQLRGRRILFIVFIIYFCVSGEAHNKLKNIPNSFRQNIIIFILYIIINYKCINHKLFVYK